MLETHSPHNEKERDLSCKDACYVKVNAVQERREEKKKRKKRMKNEEKTDVFISFFFPREQTLRGLGLQVKKRLSRPWRRNDKDDKSLLLRSQACSSSSSFSSLSFFLYRVRRGPTLQSETHMRRLKEVKQKNKRQE